MLVGAAVAQWARGVASVCSTLVISIAGCTAARDAGSVTVLLNAPNLPVATNMTVAAVALSNGRVHS